MSKADIGLIGLAVMGENLVLNIERNGFSAAIEELMDASFRRVRRRIRIDDP